MDFSQDLCLSQVCRWHCGNSTVSCILLQAVDKPDSSERWLLASQLSQLRECLRSGLTHLNWHALGIQEFVTPIYKVMLLSSSHTVANLMRKDLALS